MEGQRFLRKWNKVPRLGSYADGWDVDVRLAQECLYLFETQNRLTSPRESLDRRRDERSLRVDPVCYGRTTNALWRSGRSKCASENRWAIADRPLPEDALRGSTGSATWVIGLAIVLAKRGEVSFARRPAPK